MASTSKKDGPHRPKKPGSSVADEAWKNAPSRETTHDEPDSRDAQVERQHRKDENTPRKSDR
jgi:hypothetical protein